MADFSHLRKLHVGGAQTAEYELVELEGAPVLIGVFAGETNAPYYNALIKRSSRNHRRFKAGKLGSKELQENRDHDRELFPTHVLKDWRGVVDSKGKGVKFSAANCAEFLKALPDYLFDDVRNFFATPQSFVDDAGGGPIDDEVAHDLGKP